MHCSGSDFDNNGIISKCQTIKLRNFIRKLVNTVEEYIKGYYGSVFRNLLTRADLSKLK